MSTANDLSVFKFQQWFWYEDWGQCRTLQNTMWTLEPKKYDSGNPINPSLLFKTGHLQLSHSHIIQDQFLKFLWKWMQKNPCVEVNMNSSRLILTASQYFCGQIFLFMIFKTFNFLSVLLLKSTYICT